MEKNQKRMIAVVLCIIGIVGTLMAVKDAGNSRSAGQWTEPPAASANLDAQREPVHRTSMQGKIWVS